MKIISAEESSSLVVGSMEKHAMTIGNVSAIFHLLSEKLYTNGPLAAVREITTNAWDSHIASGCTDKPVKVTVVDDVFTIEDSGSGIPHDRFKDLYGALGGTSKAECNETTGGMGIGKLAPLAICDSFIVTNKHGGKAVTYSVNKGNEESMGIHTIDTLTEYPTDETGVSVIFTIGGISKNSIEDIYIFLISSNIRISFSIDSPGHNYKGEIEPKVSDYPFYFFRGYCYNTFKPFYVRWGNNTYDATPYINYKTNPMLADLLRVNGLSIVCKIPSGSHLNITPNREQLIENDHNKSVIKGVIKNIEETIKKNHETFIYNSINLKGKSLINVYHSRATPQEIPVREIKNVSNIFDLKTFTFEEGLKSLCMYVPTRTYISKILKGGLGIQLKRLNKNDPWLFMNIEKTKKYRKLVRLFHEYKLNPTTRIVTPTTISRLYKSSIYATILLSTEVWVGRTNHTTADYAGVGIKLGTRQNQQDFITKLKVILHDVDIKVLEESKPTPKKSSTSNKKTTVKVFNSLANHIKDVIDEKHKKWEKYVSVELANFLKKVIQSGSKRNAGVLKYLDKIGGIDKIAVIYASADLAVMDRRSIDSISFYKLQEALIDKMCIDEYALALIYSLQGLVKNYDLPPITNKKNNYFRVLLELLRDEEYKNFTRDELVVLNWLIEPAALKHLNNYRRFNGYHYSIVCDYMKPLILLNDTPHIQALKNAINQEKSTHED